MVVKQDPTEAEVEAVQSWCAVSEPALTFGHTNWTLNAKLQSTIKGWNSRCMAVITNREIAEECRYPTIDLVAVLRARSLRWDGRDGAEESTSLGREFGASNADWSSH